MTDKPLIIPEKIYYLYRITNKINGKIYIGQTVSPKERWRQHIYCSTRPVMAINFAIKKYKENNFEFEIIASCSNQDDANYLEAELIKQYESHISIKKGYNVSLGGSNAPKTEEWKAKMSAIKGGWIGRQHTLENLEKNRQAHLGKKFSEETKQKQSESMKKLIKGGWMPKNYLSKGK